VSVTVTEAGADDDSGGPALVLPMRVDGNQLATVPQGSIAELVQAIRLVLTTRPGERLVEPDFGSEDWTFAPGVDASAIEADLEQQEPRARRSPRTRRLRSSARRAPRSTSCAR
jgi:hypothetical protein